MAETQVVHIIAALASLWAIPEEAESFRLELLVAEAH